jgi:endoglucanase
MKQILFTSALLGLSLTMQAADKTVIRRNQVGMSPRQEKVIVVEGTNPKGKLRITTPDGRTLKPKATIRTAISPLSGKKRYVVDLGELTDEGTYQVSVGPTACSLTVTSHPYRDLAAASLRLFYLIRSGEPITMGGTYNRPLGHPDTHVLVHPSAASALRPAGTVISSPLGWYDAGDYNKYVVNSAFSIGLMFASYEQQKEYFNLLDTHIPESRNQTPDFLDEMMFNLRWLVTMQDPADGGVYHKLTTPNFEGFVMPTDCHQQRYVVAKSVTATLDFAAVMADAARLFEPYQQDYPGFSATAAAMAERAYQWAKEHPREFYVQSKLKDPAITTGEYGDQQADDEIFWAASALYRLTGRKQYLDDARRVQPTKFSTPSWGGVSALGAFEWLASDGQKAAAHDEEALLRETMKKDLIAYADAAVEGVETSSFQSPFGNKPGDFGWGCLSEHCCCQAMVLLYADKLTGTTRHLRHALQNADYLLGRNATGYCYVTGFGEQRPMHPHHRPSAADGIEEPFPGMLVGGPNPGQQDKQNLKAPYPSDYPDESYFDTEASYASNEIAINWNASLVAFLCWLDAVM